MEHSKGKSPVVYEKAKRLRSSDIQQRASFMFSGSPIENQHGTVSCTLPPCRQACPPSFWQEQTGYRRLQQNTTVTTKDDRKSPSKCQLKRKQPTNRKNSPEDDKTFFKSMNCFNIQEDIVKTCIQHRLNRIIYTLPLHPSRHVDQMNSAGSDRFIFLFSFFQLQHALVSFSLFSQEVLNRTAVLSEEGHLRRARPIRARSDRGFTAILENTAVLSGSLRTERV